MKRLGLLDFVVDGSSHASAVAGAPHGDAASVATYAAVDELDEDIETVDADTNFLLSMQPVVGGGRARRKLFNHPLKRPTLNSGQSPGRLVLHTDKEDLLARMQRDPFALEYASDELQADYDVVQFAVSRAPAALQYASPSLQADRQLGLLAMQSDGLALKVLHLQFRADRRIVLVAVANNGLALQYVEPELLEDFEIVRTAICSNPNSIQFATPAVRANRQMCLLSIQQGGSLSSLDFSVRGDREIALAAVKTSGLQLQHCTYEFQDDYEIVSEAVFQNPMALSYASPRLRKFECLVMPAVERCGFVLKFADVEIRKNPNIALLAIKSYAQAFEFVAEHLRTDLGFIQRACDAAHIKSAKAARKIGVRQDLSMLLKWNQPIKCSICQKSPYARGCLNSACRSCCVNKTGGCPHPKHLRMLAGFCATY